MCAQLVIATTPKMPKAKMSIKNGTYTNTQNIHTTRNAKQIDQIPELDDDHFFYCWYLFV